VVKDSISATPPLNMETDTLTSPAAFYMIGSD
jgi:hypothetical protein